MGMPRVTQRLAVLFFLFLGAWSCTCEPGSRLVGVESSLSVTPLRLDFGPVLRSATSRVVVELKNTGAKSFSVQPSVDGVEFEVSRLALTLTPGDIRSVEVAFSPQEIGVRSSTLRLLSEALDEGQVLVELTGTGVDASTGGGSGGGSVSGGGGGSSGGGSGGGLSVVCTGSDAGQPVPLLGQRAYVKASNTRLGDDFGAAVAVSGDGSTLAASATSEDSGQANSEADASAPQSGAVYVFARAGVSWVQQAYLKASNIGVNDNFGTALALSSDGNTLAVGAHAQNQEEGAVYVFVRNGTTWTQQAYVKASNADRGDYFGRSVSLSGNGDTLVVGAHGEASSAVGVNNGPQADNSARLSGAAYVYSRIGTAWQQTAYLKSTNSESSDEFGAAVAISRNGLVLAIGAPGEDGDSSHVQDNNSAIGAGAVYVFERNSLNAWQQNAYVKASNAAANDNFGMSVALSDVGDTLAVGAMWQGQSGAAYIFARDASTWNVQTLHQESFLKAPNADPADNFGQSVALSGDGELLVVGARGEASANVGIDGDQSDNTSYSSGAAYAFARSCGWTLQHYVKASNTGTSDGFGHAVALDAAAGTWLIGAPGEDGNAKGINGAQNNDLLSGSGAAYLFSMEP